MTTISIQPQQYMCKFIEAEVKHLLQTEARKINKSPLDSDFTLTNVIIDIIKLTNLADHARPLKHQYYASLPVVIYFDQLSDKSPNLDGTVDQHLMITISISQKLLPDDKCHYRLPDSVFWPDNKLYPVDTLGNNLYPESTPWQIIPMHSTNQARTPVQLGLLQLAVPMESIFCKQNTVKPTNFFPDEDGNISTIEQQTFPYSMLMDFGPSLQLDGSLDQADKNLLDNSLDVSQSQPRNRLSMTQEQTQAVAKCKSFTNPPSSQTLPQATTASSSSPVHNSTVLGLPASSNTNVTASSSAHSVSSQAQASSRPVLGPLHHDLTNTELQPLETSQSTQPPPPTPSVPTPGVQSGSQPQPSPACPVPDIFDEEAARYTDPLPPGVTTRMQAAALNLTSNQLGYLLKLLQQMNTFKEHAVSSVWLDPLVSLNKTTGIFELHQNQATPANLQVILKCMEAEAQGETLTTYAAPALTQWLEKNLRSHLRTSQVPDSQVPTGKQTPNPPTI